MQLLPSEGRRCEADCGMLSDIGSKQSNLMFSILVVGAWLSWCFATVILLQPRWRSGFADLHNLHELAIASAKQPVIVISKPYHFSQSWTQLCMCICMLLKQWVPSTQVQ